MKNLETKLVKSWIVLFVIIVSVYLYLIGPTNNEAEILGEGARWIFGPRTIFVILFTLTILVHLVRGGLLSKEFRIKFTWTRDNDVEVTIQVFMAILVIMTFVAEWLVLKEIRLNQLMGLMIVISILITSRLKMVEVEREKDAGTAPETIPSGYGNDMTLREEEILRMIKEENGNFDWVDKMLINNQTFWRARVKKEDGSVWYVLYSGSLKKFSKEYKTIYPNIDSTGSKIIANQGNTSDEIFFNIKMEDGVVNWMEEKYEPRFFMKEDNVKV